MVMRDDVLLALAGITTSVISWSSEYLLSVLMGSDDLGTLYLARRLADGPGVMGTVNRVSILRASAAQVV